MSEQSQATEVRIDLDRALNRELFAELDAIERTAKTTTETRDALRANAEEAEQAAFVAERRLGQFVRSIALANDCEQRTSNGAYATRDTADVILGALAEWRANPALLGTKKVGA